MYQYTLISVKQNFNEDKKMTLRYWDIWIESKLVNWHGPLLLFLPLWKEVTCLRRLCLYSWRFSRHHWLKHGATWSDLRAGLAFSGLDQILAEASKILWIYEKQLSISQRNVLIRLLKPLAGTWQLFWSHIKDQLYTLLLCQWMTPVWCCHLFPCYQQANVTVSASASLGT